MPKRKVPSGLKRASGMLMSPVGPAFARVDTPHAIVPIQHARKRRIAPCRDGRSRSFHFKNAEDAGTGLRAYGRRIQERKVVDCGGAVVSRIGLAPCATFKSNKILPG